VQVADSRFHSKAYAFSGSSDLEAEPSRQRDRTRTQSRRRLAEVGIGNVVREAGWIEVQVVEQVVSIEPKLKLGTFPEHRHAGQAECFGQCHIHISVARAGQRVAVDSGRLRKSSSEISAAVGCVGRRGEIGRAAI
jgi:hypothetical protein